MITFTTPAPAEAKTALETVVCDLCGAPASAGHKMLTVHDRIYGLPGQFNLVRCERCNLLYLNPRPDRAHIGQYYPDLDYHAFRPSGGLKNRILAARRKSEAHSLLAGLPATSQALEIGCGTGELLAALESHGAHGIGVEPNAAAANTASERYGLTVHIGMLDDVDSRNLPDHSFDLVLMKYALEHVHNPLSVLTRIAGLLKPGGRAVFWLPNADSWEYRLFKERWRGLDAPRHLYIFTPDSIDRFARAAGLRVTQIAYSGVPNDWAGSLNFALSDAGAPKAIIRRVGAESLPTLLALWPVSACAALFRAAGRIRVTLELG